MNWDAISAIGEIVGSSAVVITLAYLAVQTRQNSHHTKALLQQGQSDRVATILMSWATPEFADVWITGNGGTATQESRKDLQFAMLCDMILYDMMDFYHTHSDGLTSDEQFGSASVGYANLLRLPGMHAFWDTWKGDRTQECPKFITWVDSLAPAEGARGTANFV
jgi:hypothetical protein